MSSYVGTDVGIPRIGRPIQGREVVMSTVSISRAELHDRVWSEPILEVAKSLGISDVGLAKACRRHDIPTPPRGYWAKKEHRYRPKQTPLPDATKHEEVILHGPLDRNMPNSVYGEATEEPLPAEEQEAARIQVAASLRGAHALVAKANDEMAGARKDAVGLLVPPDDASLGMRVSRAQLRRALLILDAILKALNARGYATSAGPVVTIFERPILRECGVQDGARG